MEYIIPRQSPWGSPFFVPDDQIWSGTGEVIPPPPQTDRTMMSILERNYMNPSSQWWFEHGKNPWGNTSSGDWIRDLDPFGSMVLIGRREIAPRTRSIRNGSLNNNVPLGGISNPASPVPVNGLGWIGAVIGSVVQAGATIGAAALTPRARIVQAPTMPAPAPVPQPSTLEKNLPIIAIGGIGLLAVVLMATRK